MSSFDMGFILSKSKPQKVFPHLRPRRLRMFPSGPNWLYVLFNNGVASARGKEAASQCILDSRGTSSSSVSPSKIIRASPSEGGSIGAIAVTSGTSERFPWSHVDIILPILHLPCGVIREAYTVAVNRSRPIGPEPVSIRFI